MTTPFPIECHPEGIEDVASAVFETMLGLEVTRVAPPVSAPPNALTAAVYYVGSWSGALLLECSAEHARNWAGRYLSLPADSLEESDIRDGLGELTNVISGNLKPLLPPGVALSSPSVVQGSDYSLRICGGGSLFERIGFADELGPFLITLVEVVRPKG